MSPAPRQGRQAPVDDFNPDDLVRVERRSIESIRTDVAGLTERFGDDDKFGRTFEAVALKDKRVDGAVGAILVNLIASNQDVRDAIGGAVNAADRRWWGVFGKRLGFAAWSLALVAITAVITTLITHALQQHP